MIIGTCQVYLSAEWVHSLKEKRMVVKSIIDKTRHRFNVSIAEIGHNDFHQTIAIGFACVSCERSHAENMIHTILRFIEDNTDAVTDEVFVELI